MYCMLYLHMSCDDFIHLYWTKMFLFRRVLLSPETQLELAPTSMPSFSLAPSNCHSSLLSVWNLFVRGISYLYTLFLYIRMVNVGARCHHIFLQYRNGNSTISSLSIPLVCGVFLLLDVWRTIVVSRRPSFCSLTLFLSLYWYLSSYPFVSESKLEAP